MRNLKALTSIASALVLVISASSALAQDTAKKRYAGESDSDKIASFMSDPANAPLVAKAKGGDHKSMYILADKIDSELDWQLANPANALEPRMKLLAGAMANDWAPAYRKVGEMIMDNQLPEGGPMDAYGYFLSGAKLGDERSLIEAKNIALDPMVCSNCVGQTDHLRLKNAAGKTTHTQDEAKQIATAYRAEKASMIGEVEAVLLSEYKPKHTVVSEALVSLYLNGLRAPKAGSTNLVLADFGGSWVVKPDPTKSQRLLKEMSDKDFRDSWASLMLGIWYISPKDSGLTRSPTESLKYLEKAASRSDENAITAAQLLGHELVTGKLYGKDIPKAVTLLQHAARNGHVEAMHDLGLINMLGMGMAKNPHQAAAHFRSAVAKNHAKSANALAQMYREGQLGKVDMVMADHYSGKASEIERRQAEGQKTIDLLNSLAN